MNPRNAALLIFGVSLATIAGAWGYESLGYIPCELCLKERIPYYAALPLAPLAALAAHTGRVGMARAGLVLLALLFAAGAALAGYHSGVEWKWFAGPSDCAGALMKATSTNDFLQQLKTVKPVRCDEPALYVLGLTLANWDAVISAALAGMAVAGTRGLFLFKRR